MAITKDVLIKKFTQAILEGNAAIFAGAGLSRPSGFADWKSLLAPLAEEIGLDINKETDLLSIAQYYRNERKTRTAINQVILEAFSKNAELNENIKILARLPIFTYWTTNYDVLIEKGLVEAGRNPDVKSEKEQLTLLKPNRDAVVYKMHGDVSNPFNVVITKEDFESYELQRPLFRSALKGDFLSKVFLFVGFSFEDPNLSFVLSQMRSLLKENVSEHYAFMKKVQLTDYNNDQKLYQYNKNKQVMQVNELCRYGIQTVFVNKYEEITDILHEIENKLKLKNIFISGSAVDFEGNWNRIKAEKFASDLAAVLVHENYCVTSGFGLGIGSAVITGALDVIYKEKFGHVDKFLRLKPFPQNISDPVERTKKWKQYRENILEETGISIFIFGNKKDVTNGTIVEANGCIQEFEIAKVKGNLIVPVGSTGYAAKSIFNRVKDDIDNYPYLFPYLERLEKETDAEKIVNLILEIVKDNQIY